MDLFFIFQGKYFHVTINEVLRRLIPNKPQTFRKFAIKFFDGYQLQ